MSVFQTLEDMAFAQAISTSEFLFPALESLHVVGLVFVFGSIALVDLRLLGIANTDRPVSELTRNVLPWTWACFALTAISGAMIFASAATNYVENVPFLIKAGLLVAAGLNMAAFNHGAHPGVDRWDADRSPPALVKLAGGVSLTLWIAIIFAGRWIGFV